MQQVARIETERTGARGTIIRVLYQSPQWAGTIERAGGAIPFLVWLMGSSGFAMAAYTQMLGLPAGKSVVAVFIGSALSYWLGWQLDRLLQWRRLKRGLVLDPLQITITPERLIARGSGMDINITRQDEMIFTALQHREGRLEEREERRVERRLDHSFRDAWEIWLQMGHRIERLAAVADEHSARAIVRHCQQADERANRGDRQKDTFAARTAPI